MRGLWLLIFVAFGNVILGQCMLVYKTLDEQIRESTVIAEGEVIGKMSNWNRTQDMIFTTYQVKLARLMKGGTGEIIHIQTTGGQVGNKYIYVNPELELQIGDKGVFFLEEGVQVFESEVADNYRARFNQQSFYKYNYEEGFAINPFEKYVLSRDEIMVYIKRATHQEVLFGLKGLNLSENTLPPVAGRAITTFTPTTITAGTKSVLTINGTGFGSTPGAVQFTFNGGGGYIPTQPYEILSWTNSQIKVEVPSSAGTGPIRVVGSSTFTSTTSLNIPSSQTLIYTSTESIIARLSTRAVDGSLTYQLNPNINNNTAAKASLLRAMKTWKCSNDVPFGVSNNTTSISTAANDNVNVIAFGNLTGSTLGITYTYFSACSSGGGPFYWHTEELDIIFDNSNVNWYFGTGSPASNQNDFESVALHELGHSVLLGHILDPTKVMSPSIATGTTIRSPSADEIASEAEVMARSVINSTLMCGLLKLNYAEGPTVSSTSSSGSGSLSHAVLDACDGDTIVFEIPATSTLIPTSEIVIDKDVVLQGLGQNSFKLSGASNKRLFTINSGASLGLLDMQLINSFGSTDGGAFLNNGSVNLSNVTFLNNFQGSTRKAFTNKNAGLVSMYGSIIVD